MTIKEVKLAILLFGLAMLGYTVQGSLKRNMTTLTDVLYAYSERIYAATWDYAATSSSTLRQQASVALPASVLSQTRHGAMLNTMAPNRQPVILYSYGNGTTATVYAVIPGGGDWLNLGSAIQIAVANRMGVKAGIVEGNQIRSRFGGWGPIAISSLPGFAANDGDLVLRLQTLKTTS